MRIGDKVKVTKGIFKGLEGELLGVSNSSEYFNGNSNSKTMILVQLDEMNQVFVDLNDIEEVDNFPKEFENEDDYNYLNLTSNTYDWNEAIEKYKDNNDRDVIFLETENYNYDDEENVHMYTSLSVPQAKFLVDKLNKVVEYIEDKSNKR
jgi:hypothetical protein